MQLYAYATICICNHFTLIYASRTGIVYSITEVILLIFEKTKQKQNKTETK